MKTYKVLTIKRIFIIVLKIFVSVSMRYCKTLETLIMFYFIQYRVAMFSRFLLSLNTNQLTYQPAWIYRSVVPNQDYCQNRFNSRQTR